MPTILFHPNDRGIVCCALTRRGTPSLYPHTTCSIAGGLVATAFVPTLCHILQGNCGSVFLETAHPSYVFISRVPKSHLGSCVERTSRAGFNSREILISNSEHLRDFCIFAPLE